MKTRLDQIFEHYLNGREIAVWGTPTRYLLRELKPYKHHIADKINPKDHYVVIVGEDDFTDFLIDEQSKQFKYPDDYVDFFDDGGRLPFDWTCYNAKIGRNTYFGKTLARCCKYDEIESIGAFTAINETAYVDVDHQLNMTSISDFLPFDEENKAKLKSIHKSDPKHPYATNQKPLTIGNDVWIGANVFINASTVSSIGDGAIIGTGAVVRENVPPYAVVLGVPGKIKKYRFSQEMIETLLRVKWWNWSDEEINKNADALMYPDVFMKRFGGSK